MNETEQDRKVREYWKKSSIYDDISSQDFTKNDDDRLPFEPTAVLAKAPPNQPRKRSSIYNISSLDFTT
jgi:hypothetical protein